VNAKFILLLMLYQFRASLFRVWKFNKIHASLSNNPGLAQHFKDCHAIREKILGTLREAYIKQSGGNKKNVLSNKVIDFRADTLIALLEEYIPMLETLVAFVNDTLGGQLKGLETVWTSVLTDSWEIKALSANLQHEKLQVYFLYAQAIYSQAAVLHRQHRTEIQTEEEKQRRDGGDDIKILKELIDQLKLAAGIWEYLSSANSKCYPINCQNQTPEVFQDIPRALSLMALANAQEFMVQVAVETKKSNKIVAKLAEGVSIRLSEALQTARKGLGAKATMLSHDFVVYLDRRSKMYHGIALKYQSKVKLEEEAYGERVAVLQAANEVLSRLSITPLKVKKKVQPLSPTLVILAGSLRDQLRMVRTLLREAQSDNDSVYHYKVPSSSKVDTVDHLKFVKLTEFIPPEPKVLLITESQMSALSIDDQPPVQDDDLKFAIEESLNVGSKPKPNSFDDDLAKALQASLQDQARDSEEKGNEEGPEDPNAPTAPTVSYI